MVSHAKLLVVDGHAIARDGAATRLAQLCPKAKVIQAADVREALRIAAEHDDLSAVILAVPACGADGLGAIAEFGRVRSRLPVIVLSDAETARDAREALARGALGYVPRSASPRTLVSAIRLVIGGDRYVPPLVLDEQPPAQGGDLRSETLASRPRLTDRQIEVLRGLYRCRSNKLIARDLGVSEKTVKAHVTAIFKALNVVNRAQAAAAGREAGLV